jgi:adenylate kinase
MKIIIFGPQGSGKGTQAKLVAKEFSIKHLSIGDLFRSESDRGTKLGLKVKAYWSKGKLVPDKITNSMMKKTLKDLDNFILDGFPRSLNQAKFLGSLTKIDFVLELVVKKDLSIKRITKRKQCKKCGKIYGLDVLPKKPGTCDNCSVQLYKRKDDIEDKVKVRLKIYHKETEPIAKFYSDKGLLVKLDGSKPIPELFEEIKALLSK